MKNGLSGHNLGRQDYRSSAQRFMTELHNGSPDAIMKQKGYMKYMASNTD